MSYYSRIALICLALVMLIGGVIWRGPQVRDVTLVAQSPRGDAIPTGTSISLTFSRAVDRRSAEEHFQLEPEVPGRFFWDAQTLTFHPNRTLAPDTLYRVTLGAGLRDLQGRANQAEQGWTFRTRRPQLLLVRGTPGGAAMLWLATEDGSDARELHTEPGGITDIALAPTSEQAIYVTPRGPQRMALVLLDLQDGAARPLVDDPEGSASGPDWSPIGDLIVYERGNVIGTTVGRPRVWLAQPDGTSLGPLYGEQNVSYAPVWSPEGNHIALLNGIDQTVEVYDFTNNRRAFPENNGEPVSWAPDGTALVYSSATLGESGARLRIRRVDLTSGTYEDLTDGTQADRSPAWSPDGEWIAFSRRASAGVGSTLWVMRPDGSAARQVTEPGPYEDTQPVWSPDGRHIAFIRSSFGETFASAAWLVDREEGQARRILDEVTQVVWVP